jgi:hypothetical protein
MIIDKKADRIRKAPVLMGFIIFCMLITGGFVSAELFSFDNIKSYDVATKTMTIVNTFGLGKDIATIQLKTPLEVVVPVGYQKVAEFQLTNYEDYLNAFDKMEFYNIKDKMKGIEKQFDYKVLTNLSYEVNDYKKVCEKSIDEKNLTDVCYNDIVGKHTEYRMEWIPLEKVDFIKGEVLTIGIFTQVNIYDNVEWILTAYGKDITEWASYIQSSGITTTDGLYTIQTFTSNGSFNSTRANLNVSVLVVAGGGGGSGGAQYNNAGGGAGGLIWDNNFNVVAGNYNIVIGLGGGAGNGVNGINGGNSSFSTLNSGGGGGGAYNLYPATNSIGNNGGSGGGGSYSAGGNGGKGIAGQGNDGGAITSGSNCAGGGGGAGGIGGNCLTGNAGGIGGDGLSFTIYNGTALWYAGGGGGGGNTATGWGGKGGGGNGAKESDIIGTSGINGTGGGGGGGNLGAGGSGGDGIVIIRYLTSDDCSSNLINTSWTTPQNSTCNITDLYFSSKSKVQYDNNSCGAENITFWGNTTNSCNYCSFYPLNATIQDWFDINSCSNITNTKTQNSTILTYDFNYNTCYELTSLESDLFGNITYNLQRTLSCSVGAVSDESLFYVDLESRTTIVMFVFIFVFVILLGYFRKWLFVGGLLVIMGFILAFSGFNVILSFIIIASGVIAFFLK